MYYFVFFVACLSAFTAANPLEKRACQANNCLRALTGSNNGPSRIAMARSDCSALARPTSTATIIPTATVVQTIITTTTTATTTFTSGTITTTVTAPQVLTITIVPREDHELLPRALNTVPAYLSACSNIAQLSSACSCIGITASTTATTTKTLSTRSTTTTFRTTSTYVSIETDTLTASHTTTVTPVPTLPIPTEGPIRLRASGLPVDGEYLNRFSRDSDTDTPIFLDFIFNVLTCELNPDDRTLACDDQDAALQEPGHLFEIGYPQDFSHNLHCDILASGELVCDAPTYPGAPTSSQWYTCYTILQPNADTRGNILVQGEQDKYEGCSPIRIFAEAADS